MGKRRLPASRLSPLGPILVPSLGGPRSPLMSAIGAPPRWCPTAHSWLSFNRSCLPQASNTHLQARGPRWPHGSFIPLELGDIGEKKKKKVNLMGLLENSPCKEVKGQAEESPSRPRETAHSSILPGPTQGRGTTCHGLGDSHTGTSL